MNHLPSEHTNLKSGIRSDRYVLPLYSFAKEEILILAYSHPYVNEVESGLAHGCSPWGASTVAGSKGERVPTEGELEVAVHQGKVSSILYSEYMKADNRCLQSSSVPTSRASRFRPTQIRGDGE